MTLTTPTLEKEEIARHSNPIAFFVSLIFIAHPLQTQAVTYIIQRATSLAALFYLLSLCLYVKSRSHSLKSSRFYYLGSLVLAVMAMFTKEIAITLPLAVLLYEFYFLREKGSINWRPLAPFLLFFLIIPLTLMITKTVNFIEMRRIADPGSAILPAHYLLTEFRVAVTYLRLLFIPINQNLDYDYPISKTLFALPTLTSLMFLIAIIFGAVWLFRRHRLVSFSIFLALLTLLPESSVIPIRDVIFEHRLYLSVAGYSLFLVCIIYYVFGKKSMVAMTAMLIMIINWYALLTFTRNFDWRDDLALWSDTVSKSPRNARAYTSRGLAYKNIGDLDQALSDYDRAIQINPYYVEAYTNRGNIYVERENFDQATFDFTRAIEIDPLCSEAYYNRGRLYQLEGKLDQAISDYNKAIRINPEYAVVYNNRAIVYFEKQEFNKSQEDVNRAEALGYKVAPTFIEKLGRETRVEK